MDLAHAAELKNIIKVIDNFDNFIIIGHKKPDTDCLSSQISLHSVLRSINKNSILVSAGPFVRTEIRAWEGLFYDYIPDFHKAQNTAEEVLVIIIDCSNPDRTGFGKEIANNKYPVMVIDHHATGDLKCDYSYVDSKSPSTSLLVQDLVEHYRPNRQMTKDEAELIFMGLATDSGFFRFINRDQYKIFDKVSRLVEAGAEPRKTYSLMAGGHDFETRLILSKLLSRVRFFYQERVHVTYELQADTKEFKTKERDSDALYSLLLNVSNCEVVVLLKEQENGLSWSCGLRSKSRVDVGDIAYSYGGGGHKNASGCMINADNLDSAISQILSKISFD